MSFEEPLNFKKGFQIMDDKLKKAPSSPFDFMTMEVRVPFTDKHAPFFVFGILGLSILGIMASSYWISQYNEE